MTNEKAARALTLYIGRTGLDYVCCLDCGKEFAHSTQLMCIVSKEEQLEDRSQYRWVTPGLMDSPPRS